MGKYNGWKNYETWNVALWISNRLYATAIQCDDYRIDMANHLIAYNITETPDGIAYDDETLDYEALDEMVEAIA